ncbi:restriction endonuclease subunit S [Bacillus toyonensis]|uniref:restriction endonuclease subunit S n=1 Tax=Bacillus toyonensis TaxID=155322 RepID=UPI0021D0B935|nr:restriction endonuclease subunit S [Bacillus toyonensis]MCU5092051.1 restriction endonuclease subunit S [Bacillus toyonensis]
MSRVMKDSGITWVGEVPKNWKIKRVSQFLLERSIKNHPDEEVLSLYRDYGVIPKNSRDDNHNVTSSDTSGYKLVDKGNLVINKMKAWQGSMGISDYRGIISPAYYIYDVRDNDIYLHFLHYALRNVAYIQEYKRISAGLRVGQWDLNKEEFKKLRYVFPSTIEQQKRIVDFLDEKISNIDQIIKDTRQSIEELKCYKQSVITEAVTKGINKNAPMKETGVDWLKRVPKTWEFMNSKRLFFERKQKAIEGEEQLTASQKYGIISQKEFMERENTRVVVVQKDFSILKHVEPGDFVISMRSFQGGLEYSYVSGSISSAYVMLAPRIQIDDEYYKWLFKSVVYIDALQSTSQLIRDGQAMRYSNFVQVPIPCPPIEEQREISEYLNQKRFEIDELVAEQEAIVSEFETYKKSMIYEYVTGKKEV